MKDFNLDEALQKAIENGACKSEISRIRDYVKKHGDSFEALSKSKDAPYWAYWYAYHIIKGPWKEAEVVIMANPYWAKQYRKHFN